MKYDFTDRARRVLALSREEAIALKHVYVGTEHLLLALVREEESRGAAALRLLNVDGLRVRDGVRALLREGGSSSPPRGELPYTSRAKKVLEYALSEARSQTRVGTEHLALGLLREERGIAAVVLKEHGVTLEKLRAAVQQVIEHGPEIAPRTLGTEGRQRKDRDSAWFLEIEEDSGTPIYEQIIARIEEAVATGHLATGERLPSVRDLAAELGIAPGTVARAYTALETRGVVHTEGAKGTRVAETQPRSKKRTERGAGLERLFRRVVVAAFHRGASAQEVRAALERAMKGILRLM